MFVVGKGKYVKLGDISKVTVEVGLIMLQVWEKHERTWCGQTDLGTRTNSKFFGIGFQAIWKFREETSAIVTWWSAMMIWSTLTIKKEEFSVKRRKKVTVTSMVFSALSFGRALEDTFWSCSFHTNGRRLSPACSVSLLIVAYILEKKKENNQNKNNKTNHQPTTAGQ